MNKIICGEALATLKSLDANSVDMCVTSPPYYGLRDYGTEGQIGIENSPQEYIDNLTEIFMEVYRVLKPSGTLWLNIGDSYAGSGKGPMSLAMAGNGKNKAELPACGKSHFYHDEPDTPPFYLQCSWQY